MPSELCETTLECSQYVVSYASASADNIADLTLLVNNLLTLFGFLLAGLAAAFLIMLFFNIILKPTFYV